MIKAFQFLEEMVQENKIKSYGISTRETFIGDLAAKAIKANQPSS